jgi:hypothetical protein
MVAGVTPPNKAALAVSIHEHLTKRTALKAEKEV